MNETDQDHAIHQHAEALVVSLLDDDEAATQFRDDLRVLYSGDPITYAIQDLSHHFLGIATSLVSAYIFFRAVEKRHAKRAEQELNSTLEALLAEHHDELIRRLEYVTATLAELKTAADSSEEEVRELRRVVEAYQRTTEILLNPSANLERLKQLLRMELRQSRWKQTRAIFDLRWPFRRR